MASKVDLVTVLKSLTLEEKISLLAGQNFWETVPVPGKVPCIKTTDGPNGARGADFTGGTPAACFPAACSVAATFDVTLARRVGAALAEEALSKGARCLLAPTTCIHRHPLGGRNFESFSEDPFLAGKLASQVIQGVQSKGVAATIKHFAANEQETDRMTVDEVISERALREVYLRPFEIAVKEERGPWAVMTSYNSINGTHADMNEFLLKKVLRGDWGWDGLVMSDWGGTNSTAESLVAGLDLEMPGPTLKRKVPDVVAAVKADKVAESVIDDRARHVLEFLNRLKAFEDATIPPEQAIDKPEHRALIREAGARGCVLLKNEDGVLPLSKHKVRGKKIALIGLAKTPLAHGGGSASVTTHYKISPWDAMQATLGDEVDIVYAKGGHVLRLLPPVCDSNESGKVVGLDGRPGFTVKQFNMDTQELVSTQHGNAECSLSPIGGASVRERTVEYEGDFTPSESGKHYLACSGLGPTQLFIDEKLVYEQKDPTPDAMGFLFGATSEDKFTFSFKEGKAYRLRVRTQPCTKATGLEILEGKAGLRVGFMLEAEHDANLLGEAADVARGADYAVVFTGHDPQWETEGQDQVSFNLPRDGSQDKLVEAVAGANKNTIVVNSTGVAVAMPWLDNIKGLVQAWFPGQECGNSIADVLTGAVNPEGRMPVSFPARIEDTPAYGNFPGAYVEDRDGDGKSKLRVEYKEGVFVGYRHYDRVGRDKVNFPFGYGLSYSTFAFAAMKVSNGGRSGDDAYQVTVEVTNTGDVAGGVLVQVYVGRKEKDEKHPVKGLAAFEKVRLQPGERREVQLSAAVRDLGFYNEARGKWVVEKGQYDFSLGESAMDVLQTVTVTVEEELAFAA
ncbi:glycoside hydrolase superfamily [Pseudomassariella vexata]|uniref:beta-glucosidase n=1 Tax=Pseudomassariella vexata TaxID=1141098 RepID=A0A1Y2DPJ9_9PEZI|nr:glycoside hydrolase superfamily [Pseudomassariella vexata]ORY60595.1 glycoside hydrolase superfamily [Pseudomassariella vexata]